MTFLAKERSKVKRLKFFYLPLTTCIAAVTLAGCTASQIAAPQTVVQSGAIGTPSAVKGDLLYVDEGYRSKQSQSGRVAIYTFPSMKLVGEFQVSKPAAPPAGTTGMCSDAHGNVFIAGDYDQNAAIYEYAHGGTTPIATLSDGNYDANDCAVDPTTGNLAVVNYVTGNTTANISIYQNAQGNPTIYTDPGMVNYLSCTYDSSGNLFVDGSTSGGIEIAELPAGSGTFTNITLNARLEANGALLWRDDLLLIQDQRAAAIYRVRVSGSSGTVVGKTRIRQKAPTTEFDYVYKGEIIAPDGDKKGAGRVGIWPYPVGGNPTQVFSVDKIINPFSVTISQR